tara:strand:+ start:1498 stop:2229 length:732 start_codon:yes stop_codon:yes gene_type:complete
MKIAVCISGVPRGRVKRNIEHLEMAFEGADFFYSTWNETSNGISESLKASTYPEPKMHYNPWSECVTACKAPKYKAYKEDFLRKGPLSSQQKLLNATKQIIAHAYQVEDLPEEYDMIIRARWDTYTSIKVNFEKYLQDSYNNQQAIGFAIRGSRWIDVNKFRDIDHMYIDENTDKSWSRDWSYWLNDNLIIHPRKIFDPVRVKLLHRMKGLLPCEFGWYQVLSNNDNHHCVYGGAAIERFVDR